jgi:N-acetylmuramoyl-L-alanine amidase
MKMVILDAGHNEYVSGKEAPDKSMREWAFNNDMQYRINKLLCEYPEFYVYMTNPEPAKKNEIGLTKRATLANTQWKMKGKPDAIFISLHANAYGVWTNANGCETFHAKNASPKSKTFAKIVNDEIHVTLKTLNPKSVNRGVKCENFTVIKNAAMPAVLIEYGFYTNKTDLAILKNNRQELAEATVKAICEYFKIEYQKDIPVVNNKDFLVKIIYSGGDGLNVRQEPNTLSEINAKVYQNQVFTIVEEKNGWGKLKSGAGWISLNTKYVQKL